MRAVARSGKLKPYSPHIPNAHRPYGIDQQSLNTAIFLHLDLLRILRQFLSGQDCHRWSCTLGLVAGI